MIDNEKLKKSMNLAEKYYNETANSAIIELNFSFGCLAYPNKLWIAGNAFEFYGLEEAIEKLQSLVKPESKYKIGQKWFCLGNKGAPFEVEIIGIMGADVELSFPDGSVRYGGVKELFPTRQALIEHQIKYWAKLYEEEQKEELVCFIKRNEHCDESVTEKPCDIIDTNSAWMDRVELPQGGFGLVTECQHEWSENIDRGRPFVGKDRWFVRCKKCYAEQFLSQIPTECQHEPDINTPPQLSHFTKEEGWVFVMKCIKCKKLYEELMPIKCQHEGKAIEFTNNRPTGWICIKCGELYR